MKNSIAHKQPIAQSLVGAIDQKVADTMKRLRQQEGMTLATLAAKTGLSAPYLSRVENARACLTLQNLERVSYGLGVPVASFFEEDAANQPLILTRTGSGTPQKIQGRSALKIELLAAQKTNKLMEPIIVDIQPEKKLNRVRSHPGEEFNLVLEGACEFTYGKERILLKEGDSVYYDASVPHLVAAHGKIACKLLAVVSSRDYLFHGDLSKLLQLKSR